MAKVVRTQAALDAVASNALRHARLKKVLDAPAEYADKFLAYPEALAQIAGTDLDEMFAILVEHGERSAVNVIANDLSLPRSIRTRAQNALSKY